MDLQWDQNSESCISLQSTSPPAFFGFCHPHYQIFKILPLISTPSFHEKVQRFPWMLKLQQKRWVSVHFELCLKSYIIFFFGSFVRRWKIFTLQSGPFTVFLPVLWATPRIWNAGQPWRQHFPTSWHLMGWKENIIWCLAGFQVIFITMHSVTATLWSKNFTNHS